MGLVVAATVGGEAGGGSRPRVEHDAALVWEPEAMGLRPPAQFVHEVTHRSGAGAVAPFGLLGPEGAEGFGEDAVGVGGVLLVVGVEEVAGAAAPGDLAVPGDEIEEDLELAGCGLKAVGLCGS